MFSIIELQTTGEQTIHNYFTAETHDAAMSKYHEVLMYAAISSVEKHVCIVMDERGRYVARECYEHIVPTSQEAEE